MDLKILHITDLHIADINSTDEKLRVAFYEEFLQGLVDEMSETFNISEVDFIFCTGDFVDHGAVHNFDHAKRTLDFLGKKLQATNRIGVCIGNHDYVRSLNDDANKQAEARYEYYKFESNFNVGDEYSKHDFFQIRKSGDYYLLIFDSTIGAAGTNKPSILTDAQIDQVVVDVSQHVPSDQVLFVLSHYPMIRTQRSIQALEEMGWEDKHLWRRGSLIVERLVKKRPNGLTFWFFGDGHAPDFTSFNAFHHFLMTGMLGGNYVNPTFKDKEGNVVPYPKRTEAKLILLNNEITINTISYKSRGNNFDPHTGIWESVTSKIRIEENPQLKTKQLDSAPEVKPSDIKTELISESVQKEIIDAVRLKGLYSFRRYSTSDDDVSLGWVSIPRLLENRELLNRCIDKSILWLRDDKKILLDSGTVLIGLDTWGSIFVSQITVREGLKNYSVSTKDGGKHNVHFEKIDGLCDRMKEVKDLKCIVFFTDVVATGSTIIQLKKRLEEITPIGLKWICISIISDKRQKRVSNFEEFGLVGTLCSDLILPIIKKSDLPDEEILPVTMGL